ncbi:GrpE-domain-containing protein [Xylona heveae TC161]|uniref:GrpE protein homolog n=1 Tax=Xylona heveae (strain CBS 132557 / TC161) TaxID=1328760 RepID=A0A165A6U6_XYLHT|nr:GrpE-domain-containing protein [Xylona heveae TC161]KZF20035.1 GrpE-domain-containing protein [Xylona heveae TC161]
MFQRTILRQSRAFAAQAARSVSTSSSSSPALQSQFNACRAASARAVNANLRSRGLLSASKARCYSSTAAESEKKEEGKKEEKTEEEDPVKKELEAKKKELEAKKKEASELKDRYLRSVAEFQNLQERTKRDIQAAKDFAIQKFANDLLDTVDNLDRALGTVPLDKLASSEDAKKENHELLTLHDGIKMTEHIFIQTLKKHGLERFDPENERFDPNLHEATFMTPMPGKEDGTVMFTQQKGFLLNGRVVRPAKVGVVKNGST